MRKSLALTAILSFILSVFSASAADIWLSERIALLGSFAGLQYGLNPGIAWGIRLPPIVQEVAIGIALLAVLYLALKSQKEPFQQAAYGIILGGGAANIIDRLRDGYVTDYFQIGSFPVFNVADSFVTIGVALLLLETLGMKRKKPL